MCESRLPGEFLLTRSLKAQQQILDALRSATHYLREVAVYRFTREERQALHEVILNASERSKELTRVLGTHLMHEVEHAVQRLHELRVKIRNVEPTVDGIFLVDSEVMFVPNRLRAASSSTPSMLRAR